MADIKTESLTSSKVFNYMEAQNIGSLNPLM